MRLVDDDVLEDAARQLLVHARRREVHVAGDDLARLDAGLATGCARRRAPGASAPRTVAECFRTASHEAMKLRLPA